MQGIEDFVPLWGVWDIQQLIGEGGFGKVYKAVRTDFDTEYYCAIKHISIPRSEMEIQQYYRESNSHDLREASQYFGQITKDVTDEINIMYSLKGISNIVSYEEHLVIPKPDGIGHDVFIKMEYLTDLPSYASEHPLTVDDIIRLGIDMCSALEVCKGKNLIHRDIKPQNIFINSAGSFKLGDFGISRTIEKTTYGLSQKGTYSYMAPEVYKGEAYGLNADLYSLGIVLYRYLNKNRLPFVPLPPQSLDYGDQEKALKRRLGGEGLSYPCDAVNTDLGNVVLKMCAYHRQNRYKGPAEVKRELQKLLAGNTEKTTPRFSPELVRNQEPINPEWNIPNEAQAHGLVNEQGLIVNFREANRLKPPTNRREEYQRAWDGAEEPRYDEESLKDRRIRKALLVGIAGMLCVSAVLLVVILVMNGSGSVNVPASQSPVVHIQQPLASSSVAYSAEPVFEESATSDADVTGNAPYGSEMPLESDEINSILSEFYSSYFACLNALPTVKDTSPLRKASPECRQLVEERLDMPENEKYDCQLVSISLHEDSRMSGSYNGYPVIVVKIQLKYIYWPKDDSENSKEVDVTHEVQLIFWEDEWLVNSFERKPTA